MINHYDPPPSIQLLLTELNGVRAYDQAKKVVKGLIPELRRQSRVHVETALGSTEQSKGGFDVHLGGALDVFAGSGCAMLECRLAAADRVARSVGLIADRIWMTDSFTYDFADFGRATNAKIDKVLADALVLQRLSPLINSGVLRFSPGLRPVCRGCMHKFDGFLQETTLNVLGRFDKSFRLKKSRGGEFYMDTGNCFDPPIVWGGLGSGEAEKPNRKELTETIVESEIRSALWIAREASSTKGVVFSNSRIGLAGLMAREGRVFNATQLRILEDQREFSIPWVDSLSPAQIVQLREEAAVALPAFRERIATALVAKRSGKPAAASDVVAELREQAESVRAELLVRQKSAPRYWHSTFSLLGLGLSAYGLASDQLVAGVAGLLPVIQLLVQHKSGFEKEAELLSTKPGYVLVKAKDILAHSH
ncbi:MAG: hypothetical protein JNM76_00665 [Betaproteobacteria bacterium]|nr:hypothetical protein [Betaproteobacteria bacterium]